MPRSALRAGGAFLALVFLAGCASRPPIRGVGPADAADLKKLADELTSETCKRFRPRHDGADAYERVQEKSVERHSVERHADHADYTLSFIEFDGSGKPARAAQVKAAADSIRELQGDGLVVLFVHGWGHSADTRDCNVVGFRAVLADLATNPDLKKRKVIGIYVGWPARWLKPKWLHFLTYWDRSRTSNQVGISDEVRDVLRHLKSLVEERRGQGDVVSVAVGHSMGGKLLFTPMEERLEGDTKEPLPDLPAELPLFGDYVLLVNPAQDIHDFEAFTDYAATLDPDPGHRPTVLIFASEGDGVIRRTYRISRSLRNLVTPWNWPNFRSESVGLGWDRRQWTHALCLTRPDPGSSQVCKEECKPPCPIVKFKDTELRALRPEPGPFIVVRVDGRIIKKHGDIFNPTFLAFLRRFIGNSVRGAPVVPPLPAEP